MVYNAKPFMSSRFYKFKFFLFCLPMEVICYATLCVTVQRTRKFKALPPYRLQPRMATAGERIKTLPSYNVIRERRRLVEILLDSVSHY